MLTLRADHGAHELLGAWELTPGALPYDALPRHRAVAIPLWAVLTASYRRASRVGCARL